MAVAFRSLTRVSDGTTRCLAQNYILKNAFRSRINYKSSSSMVEDKTRQHVRRTEGIQPLYSQSNQLLMLHLSRVQSAEIVKFHLSDIGE